MATAITVAGGTPEQERAVRDAFERVPECLREPADAIDLRITPGRLNAEYGDIRHDEARAEAAEEERKLLEEIRRTIGSGTIGPKPAPSPAAAKKKSKRYPFDHFIGIFDRLLVEPERLADEAMYEQMICASPGATEPFFGNLDRVMLHEVVHSWHLDMRGGGIQDDVNDFLEIRFREAYDAWTNDLERIRIHEEYRQAQKAIETQLTNGETPSSAELEHSCTLRNELDEKYGEMPSRYPGDYHAFSAENGAEYFAMAIETLMYAPEVFCDRYTPEEIAFLKDMLGRCLAELKKRAHCYDAMPAAGAPGAPGGSTRGRAGMERD